MHRSQGINIAGEGFDGDVECFWFTYEANCLGEDVESLLSKDSRSIHRYRPVRLQDNFCVTRWHRSSCIGVQLICNASSTQCILGRRIICGDREVALDLRRCQARRIAHNHDNWIARSSHSRGIPNDLASTHSHRHGCESWVNLPFRRHPYIPRNLWRRRLGHRERFCTGIRRDLVCFLRFHENLIDRTVGVARGADAKDIQQGDKFGRAWRCFGVGPARSGYGHCFRAAGVWSDDVDGDGADYVFSEVVAVLKASVIFELVFEFDLDVSHSRGICQCKHHEAWLFHGHAWHTTISNWRICGCDLRYLQIGACCGIWNWLLQLDAWSCGRDVVISIIK